jgi:hypothetical protein
MDGRFGSWRGFSIGRTNCFSSYFIVVTPFYLWKPVVGDKNMLHIANCAVFFGHLFNLFVAVCLYEFACVCALYFLIDVDLNLAIRLLRQHGSK